MFDTIVSKLTRFFSAAGALDGALTGLKKAVAGLEKAQARADREIANSRKNIAFIKKARERAVANFDLQELKTNQKVDDLTATKEHAARVRDRFVNILA